METTQNSNTERAGIGSTTLSDILGRLAEKLIWIAPVGNDEYWSFASGSRETIPALRGFMVCKRSVNNPDGKNTRVDYLRTNSNGRRDWKTPFRENECMFPTMESAIIAATKETDIGLSNAEAIRHHL